MQGGAAPQWLMENGKWLMVNNFIVMPPHPDAFHFHYPFSIIHFLRNNCRNDTKSPTTDFAIPGPIMVGSRLDDTTGFTSIKPLRMTFAGLRLLILRLLRLCGTDILVRPGRTGMSGPHALAS
jgi:hypothetical protein